MTDHNTSIIVAVIKHVADLAIIAAIILLSASNISNDEWRELILIVLARAGVIGAASGVLSGVRARQASDEKELIVRRGGSVEE